jgi:hypothetical protein
LNSFPLQEKEATEASNNVDIFSKVLTTVAEKNKLKDVLDKL